MLLVSSSSEVSLVGSPSGGLWEGGGAGAGREVGPGSVSGKSSGAAAPDPRPPGHASTDACPLAVSVPAGRSASCWGWIDGCEQETASVGGGAGRPGAGASALTHHQALAKWFELMTLIQTGKGGKWKH